MNMHPYTSVAVDHLMKLVNIPSPTGFTHIAAEYLLDVLRGYGFTPYKTHKGNVVCEIGGEGHPAAIRPTMLKMRPASFTPVTAAPIPVPSI